MAILNYTTQISAGRSVGEIQEMLARHGARSILMEFGEQGTPISVSFLIQTRFGERGFRLPANTGAVLEVMDRQSRQGKIPRHLVKEQQAVKVAWRIVKDWLEAQLAIIEAGMVSLDEIMLPYLTDGSGATLYQRMSERQLCLPEKA